MSDPMWNESTCPHEGAHDISGVCFACLRTELEQARAEAERYRAALEEAGRGLGSLRNDLYSHPCYQDQAQRYLDRVLAALSKEADGE